jgi:hypothetical protein
MQSDDCLPNSGIEFSPPLVGSLVLKLAVVVCHSFKDVKISPLSNLVTVLSVQYCIKYPKVPEQTTHYRFREIKLQFF